MDMEIQIFENDSIDMESVNFDVWLTQDGEWIEIEEMADEEILGAIYTLKRKLKLLPEHVNADIWQEYLYVFQEEANEREI